MKRDLSPDTRIRRSFLAAVLLLGLTGIGLGPSPTVPALAGGFSQLAGGTRTSEGGQVTVSVTWTGDASNLSFQVVMDTHSVSLDAYDLGQLAVLRTAGGIELRPIGWDAPAGSHHREGTLTFSSADENGNPLVTAETQSLELAIRDVAGISERVFRW